jgi:hypothetical protein
VSDKVAAYLCFNCFGYRKTSFLQRFNTLEAMFFEVERVQSYALQRLKNNRLTGSVGGSAGQPRRGGALCHYPF